MKFLACIAPGIYALSMLNWRECNFVESTPEKVSGAWVFKGTRVPVKALFENLGGGADVDDFLSLFPGVSREQVEGVLAHALRGATSS